MIAYSGKQFGNDFNNGDEGLFQDAGRPRDNDKFKLRPGLQSNKWDWRRSNKNISVYAAQLVGKGMKKAATATTLNPADYIRPYLKETYSSSDVSDLVGYVDAVGQTRTSDALLPTLTQEKYGDPGCVIKDGNIQITRAGTYIVQAFAQFLFPSGYSTSSSYQRKEYVALLQLKEDGRAILNKNQGRACGTSDQLLTWQAGWFNAGDILNVGATHTYSSQTALFEVINLQRLQ